MALPPQKSYLYRDGRAIGENVDESVKASKV